MDCKNSIFNSKDKKIYKGTTPTVRFMFDNVNPADIVVAFLTAVQGRSVVFEKDINDMTVEENYVDWPLSQEDTLKLDVDKKCTISMTYKTTYDKRYESRPLVVDVGKTYKGRVI